jgi:hypothetical protein
MVVLVGLNALTITDWRFHEFSRTINSIPLSQTCELIESRNMGRIDLSLPLSYPVLPYLSLLIDSLPMLPQPCNRTLEILGEYNPDLNSAYLSISRRLIGFLVECKTRIGLKYRLLKYRLFYAILG